MKLKHQKFVDDYLTNGFSLRRAGERVGISYPTAVAWMKLPEIVEAIDQAKNEAAERNRVTLDWIVSELRQQLEWAKQGKPMINRDGMLLGYERDPKSALKALEKLGETIGAFTKRIEASGPGGKPIVPDLTSEERQERIKFLLSVVNGGSAST